MSRVHSKLESLMMVAALNGDAEPPAFDDLTRADGHPGLETWIAYHEDRLAEDEADALQEHLLTCRTCIDLLLDLEAFNQATTAEDPEEQPASLEKEATWRSIQATLTPLASPTPRLASRWAIPHTLAASFFLALVGLSALQLSQHRELALLRDQVAREQLQPNMAIHDLLPGTHRSRSSGETFEVPAESSHFTLILNLDRDSDAAQYRVVFVGSDGTQTLQVGGLKPVDYTLTLGLSRQLLPAGEYTVQLFATGDGTADDDEEPAETYRLVLVYHGD